MSIRVLIVHEYSVIHKIAQNYILTEYSDAVVTVYSSTLNAIEELKTVKYDIIFCAMEMYGMDGLAFSEAILQTINKEAHFVIMTSNYDKKNIKALKQLGIKHVLSIPFTQPQLTSIMDQIANPRSNRLYNRFVVQDTKVIIHSEEKLLKAQLINMGLNGLLCELTFDTTCDNLLLSKELTLKLPETFGGMTAKNIRISLMRISVTEWTTNHLPKTIRIAYKFIQMPPASKKIIQKAIHKSSNELTMAETEALKEMLGD